LPEETRQALTVLIVRLFVDHKLRVCLPTTERQICHALTNGFGCSLTRLPCPVTAAQPQSERRSKPV